MPRLSPVSLQLGVLREDDGDRLPKQRSPPPQLTGKRTNASSRVHLGKKRPVAHSGRDAPRLSEPLDQRIEKGLLAKLEGIVGSEFVHMDCSEAIEVLERANEKFELPVKWGIDLRSSTSAI
jgi:hypothetical protein